MNARYNPSIVLLVVAFVLSACGPGQTPTGGQAQVKAVNESSSTQNQIIQTKVFDQCQSASPLTAVISFSEIQNQERGEELILGVTAGGKVGVSKVAEIAIEGEIQKHFSEKKSQTSGHVESIQIQVPPFTKQEYTIIWREYRQEGVVDYVENGQDFSVPFSYRIGVDLASSSVVNLSCSDVTPEINSSETLPGSDWARNCISASIWTPSLEGESPSASADCYQLLEWGFAPLDGSLNMATQRRVYTAEEYGLFTPWRDEWAEANLSITAKALKNSEVWVGLFAADSLAANGLVFVVQTDDNIDIRINPSELEATSNAHLPLEGGRYENVSLSIRGGKLKSLADGQVIIADWPINFEVRYFFIGYRALPSMDLDAQISNLKFIP